MTDNNEMKENKGTKKIIGFALLLVFINAAIVFFAVSDRVTTGNGNGMPEEGHDFEDLDHTEVEGVFYESAATGDIHAVEEYIEDIGDVDVRGHDGRTALMAAANNGHEEVVEFLLDHGADVNAENEMGETAIMMAAYNENIEIVNTLIDEGADLDAETQEGGIVLDYAGNSEIEELLIDHGAEPRELR